MTSATIDKACRSFGIHEGTAEGAFGPDRALLVGGETGVRAVS